MVLFEGMGKAIFDDKEIVDKHFLSGDEEACNQTMLGHIRENIVEDLLRLTYPFMFSVGAKIFQPFEIKIFYDEKAWISRKNFSLTFDADGSKNRRFMHNL